MGITKQNPKQRWGRDGRGYKGQPVYKAISEFGWENIIHEVLFENVDKSEARKLEQEYIIKFDSIDNGYNFSKGGDVGGECVVLFDYLGKKLTSREIAKLSVEGITGHDITTRVCFRNWNLEDAMTTPKQKRTTKHWYLGKEWTVDELEKIAKHNLKRDMILARIQRGWSIERSITQSSKNKIQPCSVGKKIYEYQGNMYNSYELCQISPLSDLTIGDISSRINKHGWTVERAIIQPKRKR